MNGGNWAKVTGECIAGTPGSKPTALAWIRFGSEKQVRVGGETNGTNVRVQLLWLCRDERLDQMTCVEVCEQGCFIARRGGNEWKRGMEDEIGDALGVWGDGVEELIMRESKDCELALVGSDDEM